MVRVLPARVARLTPNDLRRTVATRLIESGVDAYTVAKITRHATLGVARVGLAELEQELLTRGLDTTNGGAR